MASNILIECEPASIIRGNPVRIILTPVGPDESVVRSSFIVEVIRPLDGEVVFRHEAAFSRTGEPLEIVWHTLAQAPVGLYQISICISGEDLCTLFSIVVTSVAAEAEAESICHALEHLRMSSEHFRTQDLQAAAESMESAAASFSRGHAHESALSCWRDAATAQLELALYGDARTSLSSALSDLFEVVRMRVKHTSSREQIEVPLPDRLPLRYSDVDGLLELVPVIRSCGQFDSQIQKQIEEQVADNQLLGSNLYGLLLLCEELTVKGEYYERLLHRYYEVPDLKDVCWVGLERCDSDFADKALKIATERAVQDPEDEEYRKFLSGSFAIIGQVQPFLRSALGSPMEIGQHLILELSEGARLQCGGGESENFRISDTISNKTLAQVPINDETETLLWPMLKKQFKDTKFRLGQLLAR